MKGNDGLQKGFVRLQSARPSKTKMLSVHLKQGKIIAIYQQRRGYPSLKKKLCH